MGGRLLLMLLLLAVPLLLGVTAVPAAGKDCKPGDIMKKGCFVCQCLDGGYWSCIKGPCNIPPGACKPGDITYDDCNTCVCTETGIWVCTRNVCLRRKREAEKDVLMKTWSRIMKPLKKVTDMGESKPTSKITVRSAIESECMPEEMKMKDCNICRCSPSGEWDCSNESCNRQKRPCKKGNITYDDCNTCFCTDKGTWMCTRNVCFRRKREAEKDVSMPTWSRLMKPLKRDMGENKPRSKITVRSAIESECMPGEMKMDDCNICRCSPSGVWDCSNDSCGRQKRQLRRPRVRSSKRTRPKATDMDQKLSEDPDTLGFRDMDKMLSEDADGLGLRECSPGKTIQIDCHKCKCTEKGRWHCKLSLCIPGIDLEGCRRKKRSVENCTPNSSFRRGSHISYCDDNGTAVSCHNASGQSRKRREGDDCLTSGARSRNVKDCTTPCVPNTTFKVDCNICKCNADGVGATCTSMGCN